MNGDQLLQQMSWLKGKERNYPKCKKMLSMNETQKGFNSTI